MKFSLFSEKGNVLVLVLGVIVVIGIVMIPVAMALNTNFLLTSADASYEQAYAKAESNVLIYQRMLVEAHKAGHIKSKQDIAAWTQYIRDNPEQFGEVQIESTPVTATQDRMRFTCASGEGQRKRSATVTFNLRYNPSAGGGGGGSPVEGPTEGSEGDEFYYEKEVVAKIPPQYDNLFKSCDTSQPQPPPSEMIDKDYDDNKYQEEFTRYHSYYVNKSFNERYNNRPVPTTTYTIPDKAKQSTVPDNVNITNANQLPAGDVLARLSVSLGGTSGTMTVNGDIIAAEGDITFPSNIRNLTVNGDIIALGKIRFSGIDSLTVKGNIIAKEIEFNGYLSTRVQVGEWAGGAPVSGNFKSIIATERLKFSGGASLQVSGNVSAVQVDATSSYPQNMNIGGSLIVGGNVNTGFVANWTIGQHISVGGTFTTGTLAVLQVSGDLYSGGTVAFGSINQLSISGSLLTRGSAEFRSNIENAVFGRDIIAQMNIVLESVKNLQVGGSVVAGGSLSYNNTISTVRIGGDLLAGTNTNFSYISLKLEVGGIFGSLQDVHFDNYLQSNTVELGGFYSGGSTSFSGGNTGAICINFDPPEHGGGDGSIGFD